MLFVEFDTSVFETSYKLGALFYQILMGSIHDNRYSQEKTDGLTNSIEIMQSN